MMNNYFYELRNRLILLIVFWFSLALSAYNYKEVILFLMTLDNSDYYLIATGVTESLYTYVGVSCFLANQALAVYFCYHLFIFLTPGLYSKEYSSLKLLLKLSLSFWLISTTLILYLILPLSLKFFSSFGGLNLFIETRFSDYLFYFMFMFRIISAISQMYALAFFLLIRFSTTSGFLKNARRLVYLSALILATIATPPDVFSQILIGSFFMISYEFFLFGIIIKEVLVKKGINKEAR